MTNDAILPLWDQSHSQLWGHQPIRIAHNLHKSPLFSKEQLAELIARYPREHYSLVQTGPRDGHRVWREGDIGNLDGRQVIEAIAAGTLWLNLRNVSDVDTRYRAVIEKLFVELAAVVPNFEIPDHKAGILISSPSAQVYYHADLPGQGLIQLSGRKRVFVYPATQPFVTRQQLEDIALFDVEVDMPYAEWYDRHAVVFDLEPGQMLHWPLNAPHRVENLDTVNISMTISYTDEEIRRRQMVNFTNGLVRHRFGYHARSHAISGPSFLIKRVTQKLLRNSAWIKQERKVRAAVDFKLDERQPGKIVDLNKAA